MKVKDLLRVVNKGYLDSIKIYANDYDTLAAWEDWHSCILEEYYNFKVIDFTWYNDDLWICVED